MTKCAFVDRECTKQCIAAIETNNDEAPIICDAIAQLWHISEALEEIAKNRSG